jgi:pimeloyl-ACP methyl ester carboxylesterase
MSTRRTLTYAVSGQKVTVAANSPGSYDRAVVVVHGTDRNYLDYFNRMLAAARKAGVADRTLILAPKFGSDWSDAAWKQGGNSRKGVSSFAAMDALLADHIVPTVLAGHSAGAQFTQRYAMFGAQTIDRYVVCNPSSFCYPDTRRPASVTACVKSFNRYKYGLDYRTGYVATLTPVQAVARYLSRTVTVANGDQDTVDNGDLDESCPAMAQGRTRLERGRAFTDHLKASYPPAPHSYVVVPGVGHSSTAMFASPVLRSSLFGPT